ncbi:hypothetical protein ABZ318_17955 [Streptomyces sp. NPDC006197]|uniref:hypothetical protein n=1 Tax=Streptomyces sp. NPDC006197 TaxID=3156685 RepID=UPI0033BD7DC9
MTPIRTDRATAAPSAVGIPLWSKRNNRCFHACRAYRVGEAVPLAESSSHGVALPGVSLALAAAVTGSRLAVGVDGVNGVNGVNGVEDDSWAVAGPGDGTVRVHGPRAVRAEPEELRTRWERVGRPDAYRVELGDGTGPQHVTSGRGPKALAWMLPPLPAVPRRTPRPGSPAEAVPRCSGTVREQRGKDDGGLVDDTVCTVSSARRPGGGT